MMMCDMCSIILTLHVKCEDGPNITITSDHLEVIQNTDHFDIMSQSENPLPKRDPNFGRPVGQGIFMCSFFVYHF